jgi:phosphomannomutase
MKIDPAIFKSYDVRAVYPRDFNEEAAYLITQAFVKLYHPKKVVLGRDVRESGESLFNSSLKGFLDAGVDVIDIGVVSTDEFYFAAGSLPVDGGITISASHNPREFNGMNFCKKSAVPLSSESGLYDIRDLVIKDQSPIVSRKKGTLKKQDITDSFLKMAASYVDISALKPMKIVANGNFGVDVILLKKAVADYHLPIKIIPLNDKPDGTFPKGPPNPLLPENRKEFLDLVLKEHADLGVSWDADGDRCFFADEKGNFIEGYFTTAILAGEILKKYPKSKVIIDPRLVWATTEAITRAGGTPIICKPGMTVIAGRMKKEGAVFGGEMSSHFYFKDNFYRDNGLIPVFLILSMMTKYNKLLSELAEPFTMKYFTPGEINFETQKKDEIIAFFEKKFKDGKIEHIDGLSVEFEEWRLNLRKSNTEPLLRLNLEAKSRKLMEQKKTELVRLIKSLS